MARQYPPHRCGSVILTYHHYTEVISILLESYLDKTQKRMPSNDIHIPDIFPVFILSAFFTLPVFGLVFTRSIQQPLFKFISFVELLLG